MNRKQKNFAFKTRQVLTIWALAVYCFPIALSWTKWVIRFPSAFFSLGNFLFLILPFYSFYLHELSKDVCAFSSLYGTEERWILCTFLYILNRPYPAHINCKTVLLQLLTTSLVCYQRQLIANLTKKAAQISLCWCTTESQSKW